MNNFISKVALFFATGFWTGFLPGKIWKPGKGGGTAGSIVALLIQILLLYLKVGWGWNVLLCVTALVVGFATVGRAESYLLKRDGPRFRHEGKDPAFQDFNETNIDEFLGQFLAGMAAFMGQITFGWSVLILVVSAVAFRFFDIAKPWGIKRLENALKGSHPTAAIMFDDALGGLYAAGVGFGFLEVLKWLRYV